MTYPNSYEGIEKLHNAEIMLIIATLIETIVTWVLETFYADTESMTPWIIALIILTISSVLTIISKILNLVGLKKASADSKLFIPAFYLSFAIILFEVILGIITFVSTEYDLTSTINTYLHEAEEIVEFIQMIIVMVVVKKLAELLKGETLIKFINVIKTLIIIIIAVSLASRVLSTISENASIVLQGVSSILEIGSFILYLIFIDKTVKFLKDN